MTPKILIDAKQVKLAVVSYNDPHGQQHTQLAVVGEKTVHLLSGKFTGFGVSVTNEGPAQEWLATSVIERLKAGEEH